ncbi:hypothetical protein AUC43_15180 [Hymenobacter sedentarius]|uniref:Uncharacterized protein n=1 Tax=Hymenobacter sedentarius TaxID=1411621 RepID=A0A0U4C5J7_9BACT|nr:hypothetical protein [Hymenobacter sedentarius]ALW86306.1 hypothetical protein AUC43_15180 [Hymenobacter sedentarius]
MKAQHGWALSAESFVSNLVKYGDLVAYDGPLLSHYVSYPRAKHYLFSWIDYDDTSNRWLVLEVSYRHLYDYLTDAKSLADIFEEPYNSKVIVLSTDTAGICSNALLVECEDLIADYIPEADSFYELAMPARYEQLFAAEGSEISYAQHLQNLRAAAVRFRLAPFEARFASTLGINDIGGFLQRVTRSLKSYVEVRFLADYRETYSRIEYALTDLAKVLKGVEPRGVNNQFGSFEIDVAIDPLPQGEQNLPVELITWQQQILQDYKRDVFDFSFYGDVRRPNSLSSADDLQMRAIFLPIVQIANNQNYYVETQIEGEKAYKRLAPVSAAVRKRILPVPPQPEEDEAIRTELTSLLLELKEGQDPSTISMAQLRRALLAVNTGNQTSIIVSNFRSSENQLIEFSEPIEVNVSRVGDFFQASYPPLDIAELGTNARAAMAAFHIQLRILFTRLQRNLEDRQRGEGLRSEKEGRILDALADLLS